jgi:beta/gamma crystallin
MPSSQLCLSGRAEALRYRCLRAVRYRCLRTVRHGGLRTLVWTLAVFFLTGGGISAQYRGGITVFTDPDFGGESASFREDTPDLVAYELNDKISSIRIPRGESWEVCQDINYANRCQIITRDMSNLREIGWDNRISSLRRVTGNGFGRGRPPLFPDTGNRGGITVFTDRDFRGDTASFREDAADLVAYGLNDKISSLRIPPGESWEVCQDIKFQNRCQIITRSIPDLKSIGWDDRISSLRRVDRNR